MERPCFNWPLQPTHGQLGKEPPRAYGLNGRQLGSRSCILQRETVLGEQTSAPMRLGSGSQRLPRSHLALCSPEGQGGAGLPLAPWALLLGWWCPQLETNSERVLLREEG